MINHPTPAILFEAKLKERFAEFDLSQIKISPEANEYEAATLKIGDHRIIYRQAKITPTKTGQFVAIWKRTSEGITAPYSDSDLIDFMVINVGTADNTGLFVFPKTALLKHGIISIENKGGKRGMRVYPLWDVASNKQAIKSQKWQLDYFFISIGISEIVTVQN